MHPILLAKRQQLCIDLRRFKEVTPHVLAGWRAEYAKGIGGGTVLFAAPDEMLLRENNQERPVSVQLDRTWTRKGELYTPPELRRLIDQRRQS